MIKPHKLVLATAEIQKRLIPNVVYVVPWICVFANVFFTSEYGLYTQVHVPDKQPYPDSNRGHKPTQTDTKQGDHSPH